MTFKKDINTTYICRVIIPYCLIDLIKKQCIMIEVNWTKVQLRIYVYNSPKKNLFQIRKGLFYVYNIIGLQL